ncbi:uncharacterized protein SPPG_06335 [Spizellomyces punctatus DAOM BR117]|uniref:G-protein coupled receptors family 2 profile 2 domain-containing protein n=1 Tax=Spizellomyces punctatus (strain DAOM BR117) TaxID=645134 RepID=A0A0L0HD68_SPIPD|nr:uncharacterized protein SPPG_06335 [Spizellomyces punctatus DAOM BR117]KNC98653.1 hypothetical protein SPPG_06335 [Spizellomyces punctatus DAOM BR117]|eukprot:XP_016606693.1 hypothetical protein SPPG_06335 [Spizellomyces punctatus DAOM BR117]
MSTTTPPPVSPPPFASAELQSIQVAVRVASCLSILGSCSILGTYLLASRFKSITNRLVFYMSVADLVASIMLSLGSFPIEHGSEAFCSAQGFIIQTYIQASMVWTLVMSMSIVFAVCKHRPLRDFMRYEKYFHAAAWGLPLISSIVLQLLREDDKGPVFAPSVFWCWIGGKYTSYRMIFFYGPLWTVFIINVLGYMTIGWIVWRGNRRLTSSLEVPFNRRGISIPSQRTSAAIKRYILKTSFYLLAFFINWLIPTVNRIQNMADPTYPIYGLFILHAVSAPLQGFLNSVVYFWATPRFLRFCRRSGRLNKPRRQDRTPRSVNVLTMATALTGQIYDPAQPDKVNHTEAWVKSLPVAKTLTQDSESASSTVTMKTDDSSTSKPGSKMKPRDEKVLFKHAPATPPLPSALMNKYRPRSTERSPSVNHNHVSRRATIALESETADRPSSDWAEIVDALCEGLEGTHEEESIHEEIKV